MGTYAAPAGARKITGSRDTSSYAFKTEDGCCLRLAMSSAQASESENGISYVATGRVILLVIPEREGTQWLGLGCCVLLCFLGVLVCRCRGCQVTSHLFPTHKMVPTPHPCTPTALRHPLVKQQHCFFHRVMERGVVAVG